MAERRSYAKGIARREEILEMALRVIAENGYSGATVRQIADAVGITPMGVLHYFGTKEALFAEVLRRRDQRDLQDFGDSRVVADDLPGATAEFVRHNADVPGLVQLYAHLSTDAADPTHPSHAYFRDRFDQVRATNAAGIEKAQRSGGIPQEIDADRLAVILTAVVDGLQSQWMYDPTIDMADHIEYLWRVVVAGSTHSSTGDHHDRGE
ncbi:TetR/AcrR family transcriptional regulator [Microbacterium sp. NPDC088619]|uniref:TetR/AcrR family transcriptional regulator n=1 Tax=Microbacterium sp. NPDC088619 TaxID=3364196 RepID=UPI00380852F5